jgi:chromosome segregation ATPase
MGNTYFFTHDDCGVQFYKDVWSLLEGGGMIGDCYVYVHDGHTYFGDTQDDVEGHIYECKEVSAIQWLRERCEDGPLFLYKAKVKELRDEMGEMKEELDGFKSICNEYLESEESSWKELSSWCDQKTDEISELKDEGGDYQYDLEELQGELQPLDEFMSDLTGVCNYEDLIDYIKGIKENSVSKVAIKQVNDLMDEVLHLKKQLEDEEEKCETTALERDGALDDIDELKKVIQQRAFRIIELENDLESTTNYWKSKYENEESVNQMLRDAIDAASEKIDQYESGDNSI